MSTAPPNDKTLATEMIATLPEDATFEDMQYHLYVLEKIRKGDEDIRAGRSHTTDEARILLAKWLKH